MATAVDEALVTRDDELCDSLRHVARVPTPSPPIGTVLTALCGARFRLRSGPIYGTPRDLCGMCDVLR